MEDITTVSIITALYKDSYLLLISGYETDSWPLCFARALGERQMAWCTVTSEWKPLTRKQSLSEKTVTSEAR